jgi:ATP-dependent helicase HepA
MDRKNWVAGQRWVSDSEPELGLGMVLESGDGRVEMKFPAADERRCYAIGSAPLRRVAFSPGDRIRTRDGAEVVVIGRREVDGLWIYQSDGGEVAETELCDAISFSKPEDRLFGGKLDAPVEFDLRGEALRRRAAMRRSPVRGLAGARMDLIPHQLSIVDEVSGRLRPRVLLADEVGLGKTIEACLILHRLLLTGRASRILILVPEPLVHQWFVELLRRFQLSFSLFDEERCEAICHGDPEGNPFLDSQWVLAPVGLLADDEMRAAQAVEAGWDVVVVDEAHHLEWSPEVAGAAWQVVARLAEVSPGLLLLTATPQQLGPQGHFSRLRLLDPERHADLAAFEEESRHYEEVASTVERLEAGGDLPQEARRWIDRHPRLSRAAEAMARGDDGARGALIAGLLDGFGVGRVMFRNTRRKLGGFPYREPGFIPLAPVADAKVRWLADWLAETAPDKVLAIIRTREEAEELVEALRQLSGVDTACFHEGLTLLQRDRNAAHFAEPEGARVLVCSEIGSEGRNFQFARHLVLMDLPDDVDLLEQRIGRLDRIGRQGAIRIHIPYVVGGAEECRLRWLDEGLDAFRASPPGAAEIQREMAAAPGEVIDDPSRMDGLIAQTLACRERIAGRLARGQDRLLERTSHDPAKAARLIERIRAWDDDRSFEDFVLRLFEFAGLQIEDLGDRRYFLHPGHVKSDAIPSLPDEGLTVTLDRRRALEREQEAFLTWDHPLVRGALDWLLGSEAGNASFAVREGATKQLFLEAWLVVECVAPPALHVERFLPPTPLRVMVDHHGAEVSNPPSSRLRADHPAALLRNETVRTRLIPLMLESIQRIAADRAVPLTAVASDAMKAAMEGEIARLRDLAEINQHVGSEEVEALEAAGNELSRAIRNARVRLDAVRLIWQTPG